MSRKAAPPSPHLRRTLDALMLASPVALASRFERLDRCIEASISTAKALKKRGISAEAIPIGVLARRKDLVVGIGVKPPPDVRFVDLRPEGPGLDLHMVVTARMGGDRWIVDPTIGQLRRLGVDAPLQKRFVAPETLPGSGFDTEAGWEVVYAESQHTRAEVDAHTKAYREQMHGLADDIDHLIDVALAARLNHEMFAAILNRESPPTWGGVMRRLEAWHEVGAPEEWAGPE